MSKTVIGLLFKKKRKNTIMNHKNNIKTNNFDNKNNIEAVTIEEKSVIVDHILSVNDTIREDSGKSYN